MFGHMRGLICPACERTSCVVMCGGIVHVLAYNGALRVHTCEGILRVLAFDGASHILPFDRILCGLGCDWILRILVCVMAHCM